MLSRSAPGSPVRPRPSPGRGLTLVELMVTVCIVAVALSLAAPSVSQQVADYRINSAAEGLLSGLSYARTEAIRRNTAVSFALNSDGTGWSVSQISPAATLQTRSNGESGNILATSSSNSRTVTFTPTGFVDGSSTYLSQVHLSSAVARTGTRQIDIFGGGLIRLCDPGVTTASDPRSC